MSDLENQLRERDTEYLQEALSRSLLVPEAAELARRILNERGASAPEPLTEAQIEGEQEAALQRSNRRLLLGVMMVVGWAIYALLAGLFDGQHNEQLGRSVFITGLAVVFALRAPGKPRRS